MRHSRCIRVLLVGSVFAGWLVLAACPSEAAEEAWRFLEGLRAPDRGYYDMALEYLDRIETSPQCPDDLKEQIDYQRAITLVSAAQVPGANAEKHLQEARGRFEKFLSEHPDHSMADTATTQLANLMVEQGKLKVALASRPSKSAAERNQLMAEARKLYGEAQKVFEAAESRVAEQARSLGEAAEKDPQKIEARDQAREDYLRARHFLAGIVYEIGRTYEPKSKEYKEHLTEAAQEYRKLYETYSDRGGGLHARMLEGRVYKELGETDKAIQILEEMLTVQGDSDAARKLRSQSLGLLLETYVLPEVKKYGEAAARAKKWQEGSRPPEESSPEGLRIHFFGGQAALERARELESDDPNRREHIKAARQHFEYVSRFAGQHQREAKRMLTDELFGGKADPGEDPADYADARDRGELAWGTLVVAHGNLQNAKTDEEREPLTAQINDARDKAIRYYHMALGLRTADTTIAELNPMRFRLAYLYWLDEDYYRAAVMGEFLARRYPESMAARQGAEIALKAYRVLYTQAPEPPPERTFELQRMTSMAHYITTLWPDDPVANEAWMMLLDTAVDNGQIEQAEQYLDKIAPDSPQRAQAELRVGRLLWESYLDESKKEEAERLPQAALEEMAQKARETLLRGVTQVRERVAQGSPVDLPLVVSVLSLVNIYIDVGQSEEAVRWLDDPKIGPMTLVAANHPIASQGDFRTAIYKAALRAYVGAQQLDKAEQTMDALEASITSGGDAAAAKKLVDLYRLLGLELQETLKRLRQENKDQEANRVARGFERFLTQVSERGETFDSLYWVAETFYSLGAGLDPGGHELPETANKHYAKAAQTYFSILKRIKEDEKFAPPGAAAIIQVRLAVCLRAINRHQEAMKLLVNILQQRENRVDVQIEAARTYQDWAEMPDKSGYYEFAIKGGQKQDGRYLVWGWGGIARRVTPFMGRGGGKYEDIFYDARYNLALSRLKLAEAKQGTEKAKTLEMAEKDITRVHQLYPQMGGQQWYRKFDALLKNIQKLRGVRRPAGLGG